MAIGAVFGAVNTMYAAVASRTREIAVLLTLGFRPRSILASFLTEATFLALVGGLLGLPRGAAHQRHRDQHDQLVLVQHDRVPVPGHAADPGCGLVFSLVMGVLGGLLPGPAGVADAGGAGDKVRVRGEG